MSQAGSPPRVVVAGHVTLDRYGDALAPGGSAYYAAGAYAALGAHVHVLTAFAEDFPREALASAEVERIPSPATSRWINVYGRGGERSQRVEATAAPIPASSLPPSWRGPDLLHLAPILGEIEPGAWGRQARARFVGLGVQGCVRSLSAEGRVIQPRWDWSPSALSGVHAACVGEDDLRGQGDLVDRLAAAVPIVAFTHGAGGCDVFLDGRWRSVGIHPAREVDPTGAGDVFAAGFFLALAEGEDALSAARLGAAAASIVVEGRGGEMLRRVSEARERARAVPLHDA